MLQVWVIVLFAAVRLRDEYPSGPPALLGLGGWLDSVAGWWWTSTVATLGGMTVISGIVHVFVRRSARRLDATGRTEHILVAERTMLAGRMAIVAWHLVAVLAMGWLDAVRVVTGNLIAIDEIAALVPAFAAIAAGWWSFYPIERSIHEAVGMRTLDTGMPAYPTPSAGQYVLSCVRHQAMLTAAPLTMALIWIDALDHGSAWWSRWLEAGAWGFKWPGGVTAWLAARGAEPLVGAGLQLAGVIAIFTLAPWVIAKSFDTVSLGDGPLRRRLMSMCQQHAVRIRDLLVWRTHGVMANGAAMGLVGRLRYILLTDALLDSLEDREIEAVMAHEVAHIRRHHIPWMAAAMVGVLGVVGFAGAVVLSLLGLPGEDSVQSVWDRTLDYSIAGGTLVVSLLLFGMVSRRFEWQADAFAAAHLSRSPTPSANDGYYSPPTVPSATVTPEGAGAMISALGSVARLNHIPINRNSWRHGSIASRQARLHALVGQPIGALTIDRTVRRIKVAAAVSVLITIGLFLVSAV